MISGKKFLLAILCCAAWVFSCGHMYSDLLEYKNAQSVTEQSFMGGSLQGIPLVYTGNSLCMGGQSIFNDFDFKEGIGGMDCGVPDWSCFANPGSLTTDGTYLYITDCNNYVLRTINISTRQSATIAGSVGVSDTIDGMGAAARFLAPRCITYDGQGRLYILDQHTVRRVNIATLAVTTIAGQFNNPGSNDGIGTAALFNAPQGITTDGYNLYIVDGNCTIRKMKIATRQVTTIAGMTGICGTVDGIGTAARLESIMGLTTDGKYLYITQCWTAMNIRRLTLSNNEVTTFATGLNTPIGITCDGTNLFVIGWTAGFWQIVLATGQVIPLSGGYDNGRGITYDGTALYVGIENYQRIDARW